VPRWRPTARRALNGRPRRSKRGSEGYAVCRAQARQDTYDVKDEMHTEDLPANRKALNVLLGGEGVVIGLGLLLVCWYPLVDRGAFRIGFFVGLAAFAAILFGPGGRWDSRSHPVLFPSFLSFKALLVHAMFLAMTPHLLLLESGIAGYRGFSSWMRYASLVLALLGTFGLLAAFVLPRWLRRHPSLPTK
jgi:hypothetical protein